jgi:hypothetical protein
MLLTLSCLTLDKGKIVDGRSDDGRGWTAEEGMDRAMQRQGGVDRRKRGTQVRKVQNVSKARYRRDVERGEKRTERECIPRWSTPKGKWSTT